MARVKLGRHVIQSPGEERVCFFLVKRVHVFRVWWVVDWIVRR